MKLSEETQAIIAANTVMIEANAPRNLQVEMSRPEHGSVRINYEMESGEQIRRVFTCPKDGGDVEEIMHDGERVPAHAYLTEGGALLTCESLADLPKLLHGELLGTIDDDRIRIDGDWRQPSIGDMLKRDPIQQPQKGLDNDYPTLTL